jgi:hypothetical protein
MLTAGLAKAPQTTVTLTDEIDAQEFLRHGLYL